MKLTPRLTLTFIIYAAALLSVVGVLAYTGGRNSLRSATFSELQATAIEKQAALNQWVEDKQKDIAALSADPTIVEEASALMSASPNSLEAQIARDKFVAKIQPRIALGEFLVVMLINPQTGEVIVATDPAEEGKFQEDRPFFIHGKIAPYVQNVYYSATLQRPAMTASAPVNGTNGQLVGVLAGRIDLEEMNSIINRRSGLRATDDAFLVNTSNLFITQPYLVTDPAVLQRGVHTEAVSRCLTRSSGIIEADDYRGVPSVITYRWLPKRELCLIVKIDQAEAYAPSRAFGRTVAGISTLALLVAAGLAIILSQSLTRPILALQSGAAHFRQGELDIRLPETSRDELGTLAREFNQMAASLSEKENQLRAYSFELEKRVEERTSELQHSEERFRLVTEVSSNAIIMSGRDGKISFVNHAAIILFGYSQEELIGSKLEILIPERFRSSHPSFRENFFGDAYPRPMGKGRDLYALRRDGSEVPVEIGLSPVETTEGLFALATITDITESKKAEDEIRNLNTDLEQRVKERTLALLRSEEQYRTLFDSIDEGFCIIEMIFDEFERPVDFRFLSVNPAFEKQTGLVDAQGKTMRWFAPKHEEYWFETYGRIALSGEPARFENYAEQLHRWFDVYAFRSGQPEKRQVAILFNDITVRRETEAEVQLLNEDLQRHAAQLEAANKELEAFSYSVSHDLRAPLRAIDGFTRILQEDYTASLDTEGQRVCAVISNEAHRMGTLIDDLLAFSRLSRAEMQSTVIDMRAMAMAVFDDLTNLESMERIDFHVGNLPSTLGDPMLIRQVWVNLISNALKFTSRKERAVIEVNGVESKDEVIYSIRDNGAGFDMKYSGKLFGVFQRLHSESEFEGTGVGLAIVQRAIHRHGGRVWAEGEVGKGAEFFFTFPKTDGKNE